MQSNIDNVWQFIVNTRANFTSLIENISAEQLNEIPDGFKNNIIWNFGHIIISSQGLTYGLSGLKSSVDENLFPKYRKGSKPESSATAEEISLLKAYMLPTIRDLKKDYEETRFIHFKPYITSMGVELNNIEDAIGYIAIHDAMHFGYAMAMKKLVI